MIVLVVYIAVTSIIVAYERHYLNDSVLLLDEIHVREERLVTLNILVARAILTVNENYFSPSVDVSSKILTLEIESVLNALGKLRHEYPTIADDEDLLRGSNERLIEHPNRATIADIRGIFHRLVIDLDAITSDIRRRKQWLLEDYRQTHNRLTVEWIGFVVVGLGVLGALMIIFFRRLADDILRAQERATAITRGYRGDPLAVNREDELGDLITAVNNMQYELRKRETQIEIGRQQQFHKEKMAAIGSLAAAVAHEINNPLSAIVGIAQSMTAEEGERHCGNAGATCRPDLIMDQAKRVMHITRQISEFSVPQSQEPELIDINGLVRSTCKFVAFDRRFRRIDMVQNLDPALPAVQAVADHLVQVLMNLLINAADAIEFATDRSPQIEVATAIGDGEILISVRDNGCGIPAENLAKVFAEHFTTKPPGRGSGLGLALCRTLIGNAGGDIVLASEPDKGTTVTIKLPIPVIGQQPNEAGREETCTS
jgi:signal transduction histidine kinase